MKTVAGSPLAAIAVVAVLLSPPYAGASTLITQENIAAHPVWTKTGSPYVVGGDLSVNPNALGSLTIERGVVVKFSPGSSLIVGEHVVLNVEGTKEEPVFFTSLKDDSVSGDTNGDGSATSPVPGDWSFVEFILNRSNVHVSYLKLRYGGAPDDTSASGPVSASLFLVSALNGTQRSVETIEVSKSATVGVRAQVVFNSTLTISNSSFFDNQGFALERDRISNQFGQFDLAGYVDARNNWWGEPSGPFHQLLNPFGLGDDIAPLADPTSQPISFDPWLTEDPVPDPVSGVPSPCASDCFSNVLFLPGIEGSRLYRPEGAGEKRLWEPAHDADAQELTMNPDGTSGRDDIYTRDVIDNAYVPIKGNVYKSFIADMDDLVAQGAVNDWESVPYDWRLSLDDILASGKRSGQNISYLFATDTPYIAQELARLARNSKTGKVTLVAHSNGGLVAKALIQRLGLLASQLIDTVIFVAVPQVGTPEAIAGLLHGHNQGMPTSKFPYALSAATTRAIGDTMPGLYALIPSSSYFTRVSDPVVTFSSSTMPDWAARYGDTIQGEAALHAFLADATRTQPAVEDLLNPTTLNDARLRDAEAAHQALDTWTPPEGVRLIQIAGWGIPTTLSGIGYTRTLQNGSPTVAPFGQFVIDGDGTVVVPSALAVGTTTGAVDYWLNLNTYNKNHPISTLGGNVPFTHGSIFEVEPVRQFIKDTVANSVRPISEYNYLFEAVPFSSETRLRYTLHSPLSLNLYDSLGRHTGISTTTGEIDEEIPGTYYDEFGDAKYIFSDALSSAHVIMEGYANGTFTFNVDELLGDTLVASTTFRDIPTTPDTIVTLDVQSGVSSLSLMRVDENGDGTTDITLAPRLNGVVTVDVVPPEAIISANPATGDLSVVGIDDASQTSVAKTNSGATITDEAGNTMTLGIEKVYAGKVLIRAKLSSVTYGRDTTIPLSSSFVFVWDFKKQTLLSQIAQSRQFTILALYDKKKNKTTITVIKKGKAVQKQTLTGLVLIKLTTNKGVVGFGW